MTVSQAQTTAPIATPKPKTRVRFKLRDGLNSTFITMLTIAILVMFLAPFAFMVLTSLKSQDQITIMGAPIWPARSPVYEYNGKKLDVLSVPPSQCAGFDPTTKGTKGFALVKKGQKESTFIDPNDLGRGEFLCTVSWRALDRAWEFAPAWSNYKEVWTAVNYPRLLMNTVFYALVSGLGAVLSAIVVSYGFSRFRFPGRDFLFIVLISTIFLPAVVTVIPTYTFFQRIGWVGTWLPLIIPHFFSNAYNVFLLRQYFMALPRELDEAAMIDGASPFRILWSVIVPQSYPAIMAVVVFHIVFCWNDYFGPLLYLSTNRDAWPISIALGTFNGIYNQKPQMIQAGALIAMIAPLLLFVLAQRFFVQGIVITGVEK